MDFLKKELSLAKNIRDKNTMLQVTRGLSKLIAWYEEGFVFLYDGETEEFHKISYPLGDFIYHCGKEYQVPKGVSFGSQYLIVAMDANHLTIGKLIGKKIVTIYDDISNVPRKQDSGGQSELRYERNREIALKEWFGKVAEKIREVST